MKEEKGVDMDAVEWARGVAISVRGHFDWSWASLHLIDTALMASMTVKWVDLE